MKVRLLVRQSGAERGRAKVSLAAGTGRRTTDAQLCLVALLVKALGARVDVCRF